MNMNTTNNNPSYIIRIKVMQGSYKNMPTIYTIDISERIDASTGPTVAAAATATTAANAAATNKQEVRRYYTSSFGADYKFKLISKVLGNKLHMHSKEPNNAYNYFHFTEFIAEDIDSDTVDIILFIVQHGHLIKDQVDADTSSIEEICDLIKVYKTLVI
ncbi:MAG: hypothetical protein QXQ68_05830 [Candidatus Nitrosocaldaceae archaeon]